MSERIVCPKCHSDQLSSEKKGFSAGKAVGGALLTGGAGVLAGFHGSNDLIIYCMNCGHHWNPKDEFKKWKKKTVLVNVKMKEDWKNNIYRLYDSKDFSGADQLYLRYRDYSERTPDIHAAYKSLKSEDAIAKGVMVTLAAVVIVMLYFIMR